MKIDVCNDDRFRAWELDHLYSVEGGEFNLQKNLKEVLYGE
jgi:hypothetical protein